MATKPTSSMEWATTDNLVSGINSSFSKIAPPPNCVDYGWVHPEVPVRNIQNYWMNAAYQWQQYLETYVDELITAAAVVLASATAVIAGVDALADVPGEVRAYPTAALATANGFIRMRDNEVSRTGTTAALFGIFGTNHGVGDGSTTFNLPDTDYFQVPVFSYTSTWVEYPVPPTSGAYGVINIEVDHRTNTWYGLGRVGAVGVDEILKSTDDGLTWTVIGDLGSYGTYAAIGICIDGTLGDIYVTATTGSSAAQSQEFYRLANGSSTLVQLGNYTALVGSFSAVAGSPYCRGIAFAEETKVLWMATLNGIWYKKEGEQFKLFENGFPGVSGADSFIDITYDNKRKTVWAVSRIGFLWGREASQGKFTAALENMTNKTNGVCVNEHTGEVFIARGDTSGIDGILGTIAVYNYLEESTYFNTYDNFSGKYAVINDETTYVFETHEVTFSQDIAVNKVTGVMLVVAGVQNTNTTLTREEYYFIKLTGGFARPGQDWYIKT